MIIPFVKYQGTGNDFVIVDDRTGIFPSGDLDLIKRLTDRKFGIGADGLILLSDHEEVDFWMRYFNPDGSESFCGNGSRCAVHYAHTLGMVGTRATFEASDGIHKARIEGDTVSLGLHDLPGVDQHGDDFFIDNGSPHHVTFVEDLDQVDVRQAGHHIRYSPRYHPHGTNVNFVRIEDAHRLTVRTYERGVENETLSCGTGVTASALAASRRAVLPPIDIDTRGGRLQVDFDILPDGGFRHIFLSGPARLVFRGEIDLNS